MPNEKKNHESKDQQVDKNPQKLQATKTLLVETIPSLRKLLTLNLELYTGTKVINRYNADDLNEYLKRDNKVDLIICKNMVGEENTLLKIYYYVNSNKLDIPILLLGNNFKLKNEVEQVEPSRWKQIIKTAAKFLKITAEDMMNMEVPDFYPIDSKILLSMTSSPIDIMAKTKGGEYKTLYVKDTEIDPTMLKQMILKGLHNVYIPKNSRLNFATSFSDKVQSIVQREMSVKDKIYATGESFSYSRKLIGKTGLTEESTKMAQSTIGSMIRITKQSKELSKLLEIVAESEDGYLYKHSVMIAMIGSQVIKKMEWERKSLRETICFLAFFHDIAIPDDNLCQINSNEELAESTLSDDLKDKVKKHALIAKELISSYPKVPFGAESFILQHHGMKNGVGFGGKTQNMTISPLAILFRVVEEYVDDLINPKEGQGVFIMEKTLNRLKEKYNRGQYKKAVAALFETVTKKHTDSEDERTTRAKDENSDN